MKILKLFTDGSVNPLSHIGYGAYLAVPEGALSEDSLGPLVKVKGFEQTSSTKLELQTLLWALSDLQPFEGRVIIHTDSHNIMGLPARRGRYEQHDFRSKKMKRIANYELYQAFYRMTDLLDCEYVKVRGHRAAHQKDEIDRFFTLVDRAARKALRKDQR